MIYYNGMEYKSLKAVDGDKLVLITNNDEEIEIIISHHDCQCRSNHRSSTFIIKDELSNVNFLQINNNDKEQIKIANSLIHG